MYPVAEGQLSIVRSSNNDWFQIDTPDGTSGYWLSFQYDQTVPGGSTINSVNVYVEHYEDSGFNSGEMSWEVGGEVLTSPSVLGSTTPTVLTGTAN